MDGREHLELLSNLCTPKPSLVSGSLASGVFGWDSSEIEATQNARCLERLSSWSLRNSTTLLATSRTVSDSDSSLPTLPTSQQSCSLCSLIPIQNVLSCSAPQASGSSPSSSSTQQDNSQPQALVCLKRRVDAIDGGDLSLCQSGSSSPQLQATSSGSWSRSLAAYYYAEFGVYPDVPQHLAEERQRTKRQRVQHG